MRQALLTAVAFVLLTGGSEGARSLDPTVLFFDAIRTDHAAILAAIERLKTGPPTGRQQSLRELENRLVPHLLGEESGFYPALVRIGAEDLALRAAQEHQQAVEILRGILWQGADAPELLSRVGRLQELLQAHMRVEEEKLLPLARERIDDQQMQRILVDFQAAKEYAEEIFEGR